MPSFAVLRVGLILALILVGALAGVALNFASAFLAIPIGLVLLAVILLVQRRTEHRPATDEDIADRNRLGARRIEFTESDRRTLSDEPRRDARG